MHEDTGIFHIGGDLPVRRMGFGAMRLVGPDVWGPPAAPSNSTAVLREAVRLGVQLIDTAEAYGPRLNEEQIAEALSPYPDGLVIATKCGLERFRTAGVEGIQSRLKGSRAEIRASAEGSLERLRLQRIHLYQLHRIDPEVRVEHSIEALSELQGEGKLQHIGVSEVSLDELKRALSVAPIASVQNRYNVRDRKHEDVLAFCEDRGIAFLPWFPLGNGALCSPDGPLGAVAARHARTPSQIALAWLLAKSPVIIPIPGTGSLKNLRENVAATEIRLSSADLAELDQIASRRH